MKIFYLIQVIVFVFLVHYLYRSLVSGVFNSNYGENLTVRKQEEKLGFYFTAILYLAIIFGVGYILITRRGIFF